MLKIKPESLYIYVYVYVYVCICMYVPVLVLLEILCHLLDKVNYSMYQQYPVQIYGNVIHVHV